MKKVFESNNINYVMVSNDLINDYLIMVNDPNINKFLSAHPKTYSYEDEVNWVQSQLEKKSFIFSMIEKKTEEYIGNIEIMNIENGSGEIGICITASKQNQHYGNEAIQAIMKYAAQILSLRELTLVIFSNNERAIHCYQKLGFVEYKREKMLQR